MIHDAEVAQAQEIHLHEPHLLELGVREAGNDHAILIALVHRHEVKQWGTRQDERAGVHAGASNQPLEAFGSLNNLGYVRVICHQLTELLAFAIPLVGGVEDLVQWNALAHHVRGHCLGDLVAEGEGIAENTVSVFDSGLRLNLAEGVDLAGVLSPVLVRDVINDLVTLTIVEVKVDIGWIDALRVEEPLEQ